MPIHEHRSEYQLIMANSFGLIANGASSMLEAYLSLEEPGKELTQRQAEYIKRVTKVFDGILFQTANSQELEFDSFVDVSQVLRSHDFADLEYLTRQAQQAKHSCGLSSTPGYTVEELHELVISYRELIQTVTDARVISSDQIEKAKETITFLQHLDYHLQNPYQ